MAAIKNLQLWCKQQCEGYRDVSITNMTTSFRDGLAFCAILHRHKPDLIDFNVLSKENIYENNALAFRVAEEQLGIPALLDAEDMVALRVPDRLSILTYVSQYYNYFHGRSPIGGLSGIKRPTSESSEEPPGKKAISEPIKPPPVSSTAHPPAAAKINPARPRQDLPKENSPVTSKRVLTDSGNLRGSSCAICGSHVHLVQRYLVDGKLYHRNCFRCKQCSNTLLSGAYKTGTEPGTYICTSHQQPASLWNSGPRSIENKPTSTSMTSGDPQKVLVKSSQLNKGTNSTSDPPSSIMPSRSPAGSSSSSGPKSPNAPWSSSTGNKSDYREGTTSPSWTASGAKTQQARKKFFESSEGTSGSLTDKSPATKDQVLPSLPSQAASNNTPGIRFSGANSGSTEKDKARQHLTQALPASNATTNRPGGVSSSSSPPPSSFSSTISPRDSPDHKIPANKPGHAKKTEHAAWRPVSSPKSPGEKLGVWAATQNGEKDPATLRPADTGRKPDWKDTRGGVNTTEDKSENPAAWRSKLKPVANKDSNQGGLKKPMDSSKVTSPAQGEEKSASSIATPANKDTAPSAALPQKKKLIPDKDLLSDCLKRGEPAKEKESGQSKQVSSPVKPPAPKIFQSLVSDEVASPTKLQEDYIPEEEIQEKVREIEKQLDELELKGVDMEKHLRDCEEDDSEDALMVDWFKLIHEKQLLLRLESELMYKSKQQKLEEKQWNIESELRRLMSIPEEQKTYLEKKREKELLDSYVNTVNDRNDIVECLDEDRLRELEEDQVLADMLRKLDASPESPEPNKRKNKFRWSKIWKQKSKKKAQQ
ncbi:MICAL-like protein 2 [Trachemys scripta elegans]|uniref:MICAL-like protein 2 n=1 Tax=Trachemys scripta elegans TaxID=31138 RepID=UPI001553D300|nr:MICAL-like protein 2 [Trachemys scripta elegans]XP_034640169.1 MICAL-like protein 2 [Trachemys scripta elegans]